MLLNLLHNFCEKLVTSTCHQTQLRHLTAKIVSRLHEIITTISFLSKCGVGDLTWFLLSSVCYVIKGELKVNHEIISMLLPFMTWFTTVSFKINEECFSFINHYLFFFQLIGTLQCNKLKVNLSTLPELLTHWSKICWQLHF